MHSKSLVGPGVEETVQLMKPRKTPEDFEFFQISTPAVADGFASSRASCPGARDLQAFARGELDTQAAAAVRAHLENCVGCQEVLAEIRRGLGLEEPITRDAEQLSQTTDPKTQTQVRRPGFED